MGSNSGHFNSGQCTGGSTSAWPGALVPVFKQHLILLHEPAGLCGYTGIGHPVSIYCISDMSPVLCIKGQGHETHEPAGLCGYTGIGPPVSIYCISDMSPVLCIKGQGHETHEPA